MKYQNALKSASEQPAGKLYEKLKSQKSRLYKQDGGILSRITTAGCTHCFREDELIGCSMCNLHYDDYTTIAELRSLRKRDPGMYCNAVCSAARAARPDQSQRTAIEYIFAYNFFDSFEIPDILADKLLTPGTLFSKKPYVIQIEGRADMVQPEVLKHIRNMIYPSKLIIRLGIECANEWVRNHWLNKEITNKNIQSAIEICHELGIPVVANVLFGIPGFTEVQSISHFVNSAIWLDNLGVEFFNCSVLVRKSLTLQGLIHHVVQCKGPMQNIGIYDIEHAGLPWLYSMIHALQICDNQIKNFEKRLSFGQYDPYYFSGDNSFAYNASHDCICNFTIFQNIKNRKNIKPFLNEVMESAKYDKCKYKHDELLEKQKPIANEKIVMLELAGELSNFIWANEANRYYNMFVNELKTFNLPA